MAGAREASWRRWLWFIALWAAGVVTVGAVGYAIKLVLSPG